MGRGDGSEENIKEKPTTRQEVRAKMQETKEGLSSVSSPGAKLILKSLLDDDSGESRSIHYRDLRAMIEGNMLGFSQDRIRTITDEGLGELRENDLIYKPKRGAMEWSLTPEAEDVFQLEKELFQSIKNTDFDEESAKKIFVNRLMDSFDQGYDQGERVFLTDQDDDHNSEVFRVIAEKKGQSFTEINLAEKGEGPEIDFENLTVSEWPDRKGGLPANLERLRSSLQKPGIVYINSKSLGSDLSLGSELPDAIVKNLAQQLSAPGDKKTFAISGENVTVHKDCTVIIGYDKNADLPFEIFERFKVV